MKNQLIKKIKLNTKMSLVTGLHIGSSSDNVEIGGVDKSVVRRTIDQAPYVPGSSIKGKIRCLLEQVRGASDVGKNGEVNDLFGFAKEGKPSRIIVRDSYLTATSRELLEQSEFTDMPLTEVKFENSIDRVKGQASNPRQIERVPAGASFHVQFVINVWDTDEDGEKSLRLLKEGIALLENDYLGGNGSRGYGQVKFDSLNEEIIDLRS